MTEGFVILRCAECGERIARGRAPGTFTHRARLAAACDLDSAHRAVPDWSQLGELRCRACGGVLEPRPDGSLEHAGGEADHPADPDLPL